MVFPVLSDSSDISSYFDMGNEKPAEPHAEYLFCGGEFSQAVRGEEEWIRCVMCNLWAHNKFSGCKKLQNVCDFCK
jgi:hypothetical protein